MQTSSGAYTIAGIRRPVYAPEHVETRLLSELYRLKPPAAISIMQPCRNLSNIQV